VIASSMAAATVEPTERKRCITVKRILPFI
jgi:hypothetical protein